MSTFPPSVKRPLHCEALSSRNLIHTRTRVDLNLMMLKRLADSGQSIYFKTWKVLDRTDQESLIPWKNCFSEAEVASNDFWQIVTSPTSTIFFRAHFSLQGVLACNCPTASTNGLKRAQGSIPIRCMICTAIQGAYGTRSLSFISLSNSFNKLLALKVQYQSDIIRCSMSGAYKINKRCIAYRPNDIFAIFSHKLSNCQPHWTQVKTQW